MLQFFGGSGGAQKFDSTPTAGKPSIAIGNGTFGGGAAPDFQGTTAIGVNMVPGYTNNLLDLQVNGTSLLSVDYLGSLFTSKNVLVAGGGALFTSFIIAGNTNAGVFMASSQTGWTLTNRDTPGNVPFTVAGMALQTGDLLDIVDSVPVTQFGIANKGTGVAPKWALRIATTANAESMAQTHIIGAATGKAIQVVDNAGTTIGWIPLNA